MSWLLILCMWVGNGVSCITPPTQYASREECAAAVGEARRISNDTKLTSDFYVYCLRSGTAK